MAGRINTWRCVKNMSIQLLQFSSRIRNKPHTCYALEHQASLQAQLPSSAMKHLVLTVQQGREPQQQNWKMLYKASVPGCLANGSLSSQMTLTPNTGWEWPTGLFCKHNPVRLTDVLKGWLWTQARLLLIYMKDSRARWSVYQVSQCTSCWVSISYPKTSHRSTCPSPAMRSQSPSGFRRTSCRKARARECSLLREWASALRNL